VNIKKRYDIAGIPGCGREDTTETVLSYRTE